MTSATILTKKYSGGPFGAGVNAGAMGGEGFLRLRGEFGLLTARQNASYKRRFNETDSILYAIFPGYLLTQRGGTSSHAGVAEHLFDSFGQLARREALACRWSGRLAQQV